MQNEEESPLVAPDIESQWSDWMRKAQGGDSDAYEMLLLNISPFLERFIRKRIFDKNSIEDILQETLLGIHKARATFNSEKAFGPWMYAIARYKMLDFIRKKSRRDLKEVGGLAIESLGHAELNPNSEASISENLQTALEILPEKQKLVVQKLKLEEKSIKEISAELKMSESAVKVTAHRAYKKLLKVMEERIEE